MKTYCTISHICFYFRQKCDTIRSVWFWRKLTSVKFYIWYLFYIQLPFPAEKFKINGVGNWSQICLWMAAGGRSQTDPEAWIRGGVLPLIVTSGWWWPCSACRYFLLSSRNRKPVQSVFLCCEVHHACSTLTQVITNHLNHVELKHVSGKV